MKRDPLHTDEDLAAAIALNLTDGVGVVGFRAMMRDLGSGGAILKADEARLRQVRGIGGLTARKIVEARGRADWEREARLAEEQGARIVPFWSDDYPRLLKQIFDPPVVLYVKGMLTKYDALAIGIVGSRRCSYYGTAQAERLARELAVREFTVVSGLARGIDAAAHRGALAAGGRTIAVLGNGLMGVYPPEHEKLAEEIAQSGAVVSEFPMETRPAAWNFPRRNRVASGMSLGVVVVEAGRKSGALITARFAMEHGREVFAVPGKVDNPFTRGTHGLIKDGAKLVEGIDDILEELGPVGRAMAGVEIESVGPKPMRELSDNEEAVRKLLSSDPLSIETIVEKSGLAVTAVSSALTMLELDRLVEQLPGKMYVST